MSKDPSIVQRILSQRMLLCCTTGFASGMPLYVLYQLVPAWLRDQGVDLKTIGLFSLISIPYVWKFLWAPLMDQPLPFSSKLGRRRGWGLLSQLLLTVLLASLALLDPNQHIKQIAAVAFGIAFCSASQDIVLDAYRRELLPDEEQGLGSSLFVNAYRLSSLVPGSLALLLADHYPWAVSHLVVAAFMGVGITTSLLMPEPKITAQRRFNLASAVVDPLREFFTRNGWQSALLVLVFMLCYKLGDSMATALSTPFYLDMGFTKTDIASIVKGAALWSSIVGGLLGGIIMIRLGINRSLWCFGVIQLMTILGFAYLADHSKILPITAMQNRSIASIESTSKLSGLDQWLEDGTEAAPIYINELSIESVLEQCEQLSRAALSLTAKDTNLRLLNQNQIEEPTAKGEQSLKDKCPRLDHRIRLNLVTKDTLRKVLSEEELQDLQKLRSTAPFISTFEQLKPLKLSPERMVQLQSQLRLKADAQHAPAVLLAKIPGLTPSGWLLFFVVSAEYLGVGLGTAAFVAFIATKTNKAYTAAQFALLTSISGLPRTFASATTGYLIESMGYTAFFLLCTALAFPGMLLLLKVAPWNQSEQQSRE